MYPNLSEFSPKRAIIALLIVLLLITALPAAKAETTGYVNVGDGKRLNVRSSSSIHGDLITTLKNGRKVVIIQEDSGWGFVELVVGNSCGWVCLDYISAEPPKERPTGEYVTLVDKVRVRQEPDGKVVLRLDLGTDVVVSEWKDVDGTLWAVTDDGYICSDLIAAKGLDMQRAIPRRSSFSGAYLGVVMSWYQLTTSETLAIRLKDVHFYIGAKEVDANVDARSITRVVIDTPNSTIHQDYALINSPDVIELVYLAYHAALPNNQHGMLLEVDGELPSANTYLRRLQRTLDHINTISGKAFTLFSIRQSGCWHAVYLAWKREGFSWKFDPSTREVFAQHANRIVDRNTTYREIFAQFVDYVAATQDEPALKQ